MSGANGTATRRKDLPRVGWRVQELARGMGFDNAREFGFACGLYPASAEPIWDGTAKQVKLETLEKLSRVLGVPVGELFTYQAPEVPADILVPERAA